MFESPVSSSAQKLAQSWSVPLKMVVHAESVRPRNPDPVHEQQQYWHTPALQRPSAPHTFPQAPQLLTSVCVFTQVPLQLVNPLGQVATQVPF
jgi:hypothetical protein